MRRRLWTGLLAGFGLIVLIIDAKTALLGATEGIDLCIKVVIPSLFPFFILSILLTSTLTGQNIRIFEPIGRFCGMPKGSESLLIVGLLGGYPTGAQAVSQAYSSGQIRKKDAVRLLGFCSNAGPAFLFGMAGAKFPSPVFAWALWGIHILSAIAIGALLPGKSRSNASINPPQPITLSSALERSIKIMASVCGWVLLFRVIIEFLDRWFLWLLPVWLKTIMIGILELSNGCCELELIEDVGLRFVACSGMLGLGGLCVAMQTVSVTKDLGVGMYFPGKVLQCLLSVFLSAVFLVLTGVNSTATMPALFVSGGIFVIILLMVMKMQKKCSIISPLGV